MVTAPHTPAAILFALTAVLWILFEISIVLRGRRERENRRDKHSMRILLLTIVGAVAIGLAFQDLPFLTIPGDREMLLYLGTALVWSGVAFRIWAIRTLGPFFTAEVTVHPGQKLVTAGPYRYLRHPSYTGSLVAFLGLGIGLGNILGCILMLLMVFTGIHYRINVEEEVLLASFGTEYGEYMEKTKRVIPFVY